MCIHLHILLAGNGQDQSGKEQKKVPELHRVIIILFIPSLRIMHAGQGSAVLPGKIETGRHHVKIVF
jgi:hypothetical protein